jgi:hypothetical protein
MFFYRYDNDNNNKPRGRCNVISIKIQIIVTWAHQTRMWGACGARAQDFHYRSDWSEFILHLCRIVHEFLPEIKENVIPTSYPRTKFLEFGSE